MAITAVDPVIAHMMFVTERHRLIQRHADIRRVWRPKDFRGRPAHATNKNDYPRDDYSGIDIRARRKELGHDEPRVLFAKEIAAATGPGYLRPRLLA